MKISDNTLYLEDISAELIMQEYGSPLYVYEESVLRSCFRQLMMRKIPAFVKYS